MNLSLPRTRVGWIIGGISLLILLVVSFLLLIPREPLTDKLDVSALPWLNAILNGSTAVLLVIGYILIRRRQINRHRTVMITAFALSSLFLVSYVILHTVAGSTKFLGQGWIRPLYFIILISHIILSAAVLPLALTTLYQGWVRSFRQHRRIARWTYPIWLYTSISGVVVYLILYHWPV
jgi:putative membrane protein